MVDDLPLPARAHVLGIGGVGMSAVALLLRGRGVTVTGSDLRASPITRLVHAAGCALTLGPDPAAAAAADWWIHPPGLTPDHPEATAARAAGRVCLDREAATRRLLADRAVIGVIGTHGRGLTAALLAALLGAEATGVGHLAGVLRRDGAPHVRDDARMVVELDERLGPPPDLTGVVSMGRARPALGYYDAPPPPLPRPRALRVAPARAVRAPGEYAFSIEPPDAGAERAGGGRALETLRGVFVHDWAGSRGTLEVGGVQVALSLPPGPLLAECVCAAAAYAHGSGEGLEAIARRAEATASTLVGHLDVRGLRPLPLIHEVRTYPVAIARALADLRSLGAVRVGVLLRPYPPTFDRGELGHLVDALARAVRLVTLPPYPGGAPRARVEALVEALRGRGVRCAEAAPATWLRAMAPDALDAVLGLGGEDVGDALDAAREIS